MTEQEPSLPDSYENWYQQGKEQSNTEEYAQAIASFDRALQYDFNAYDAWYCKGNALFYLSCYEEAIDCYKRAASIEPDSYVAWESCGFALQRLKEYEAAISSLNRALEIKPDNYGTFWARGNAFYGLEKIEEAVEDYEKALVINPDAQEVWTLHGNALFALRRYKQALESYEKALALQRKLGDRRGEVITLESLTHLYIFNGRIQDSFLAHHQIMAIARELNLSPDDPLYPLASNARNISPETLSASSSKISSLLDKMGWMGKLMGFATKGKLQSGLFVIVWLLFAVASVAFIPIKVGWWLIKKILRRT